MAGKTSHYESQLDSVARWLSCNGEVWGMGPTAVFASAAALFLYKELEATVFMPGDHERVSLLEKSLVSTMVVGMLALMIHLWVCSMRFFQYYLDTLIKDSPSMLLEMTTVGLLGSQAEMVPFGPLTRFLKLQQPQIHITFCWFLALCYADYVRKHYCRLFNIPYLEQWQTELHQRAARGVQSTVAKVNSLVTAIQSRMGYADTPRTCDANTLWTRVGYQNAHRRWRSAERQLRAEEQWVDWRRRRSESCGRRESLQSRRLGCRSATANISRPPPKLSQSCVPTSRNPSADVAAHTRHKATLPFALRSEVKKVPTKDSLTTEDLLTYF